MQNIIISRSILSVVSARIFLPARTELPFLRSAAVIRLATNARMIVPKGTGESRPSVQIKILFTRRTGPTFKNVHLQMGRCWEALPYREGFPLPLSEEILLATAEL